VHAFTLDLTARWGELGRLAGVSQESQFERFRTFCHPPIRRCSPRVVLHRGNAGTALCQVWQPGAPVRLADATGSAS
jgi:hypothetical protein